MLCEGEHDACRHEIATDSEDGDSMFGYDVQRASRKRDVEVRENDAGKVVEVDLERLGVGCSLHGQLSTSHMYRSWAIDG